MKKNVTYIAAEKFTAILEAADLKTKENAGFVQVILGNGYHLYVAKTKAVGRVDIQWAPEIDGVTHLGMGERFGRILAQLDFSRTEAEILETFKNVLENGLSLAEYVRPKKVQPGTVKAASSPEAAETEESKEEAKAARKALIARTAKEMGVEVSEEA